MIRKIAKGGLATVLALASVVGVKAAEIKLSGPEILRPGVSESYSVEMRNDDVPGERTRGVEWRVSSTSSSLNWSSPVRPIEVYDFFVPFETNDIFSLPPVKSGRYTWSSGEWAEDMPWNSVADYSVNVSSEYAGPFPGYGKISLGEVLAYDPSWVEHPVSNVGSIINFEIHPRIGDVNGDGEIDGADAQTFTEVVLGIDVNPDHYIWSDASGNGDGVVDGRDIQPFVNTLLGQGE